MYFDAANTPPSPSSGPPAPYRFVQVTTRYIHPTGQTRLRVTTKAHVMAAPGTDIKTLASQFDQEAAAVLLARAAVYKVADENLFDVLRWLDKHLIKLVNRFAQYTKNDPESLQLPRALPETMFFFPNFMYHLRRSNLLQIFNISPDESTYYRLWLQRSRCEDAILIINPTLHSYVINEPCVPVPLDATSVKEGNVLLMDTFFDIIVHYGSTVDAWRNLNYHENPEFANVADLLRIPNEDAKHLAESRLPRPIIYQADHGDSVARRVYVRVNPSKTHKTDEMKGTAITPDGQIVVTEDASLKVFLDHLKKMAVQS